jgi:hypothetical protein
VHTRDVKLTVLSLPLSHLIPIYYNIRREEKTRDNRENRLDIKMKPEASTCENLGPNGEKNLFPRKKKLLPLTSAPLSTHPPIAPSTHCRTMLFLQPVQSSAQCKMLSDNMLSLTSRTTLPPPPENDRAPRTLPPCKNPSTVFPLPHLLFNVPTTQRPHLHRHARLTARCPFTTFYTTARKSVGERCVQPTSAFFYPPPSHPPLTSLSASTTAYAR